MNRILCIGHTRSVCYVLKDCVRYFMYGKYERSVIMTKSKPWRGSQSTFGRHRMNPFQSSSHEAELYLPYLTEAKRKGPHVHFRSEYVGRSFRIGASSWVQSEIDFRTV